MDFSFDCITLFHCKEKGCENLLHVGLTLTLKRKTGINFITIAYK